MKKLFSKRVWLVVAHAAVIGGALAGVVLMPPLAIPIITAMGATNALIPSPLSPVTPPAK